MNVIETAVNERLARLAEVMPPPWRGELDALLARADVVEELRLRVGMPLTLRTADGWLQGRMPLTPLCLEELLAHFCEGALYAHRESLCQGYVTMRDGCRVGVCGRAVVEDGRIRVVGDISSLCLRLPGALPSSAVQAAAELLPLLAAEEGCRSLLICAPPGAGKTTLLRALALQLSRSPVARQTAVVDTRGELTPFLHRAGGSLDLLTGYPRAAGIEIALRTLGAEVILCDEIGSRADAEAILDAQACGVPLVATAHGTDPDQLRRRPALQPLFAGEVFGACAVLHRKIGDDRCYLVVTRLCP